MSHEEFLKVKPKLIETFATAMEKVLIDMGEDIKGIEWFCSSAAEYNK